MGSERLAAIEIESGEDENTPFEVVNVGDEIDGSALSRIARQLGVEVPANMPSRRGAAGDTPLPPIDSRSSRAISAIPPKTDPKPKQPFTSAPPPVSRSLGFDDLLSPVTRPGPIRANDLDEEDLSTIEALRVSMEKGALVLRSLAELCLEKGVFTRDEAPARKDCLVTLLGLRPGSYFPTSRCVTLTFARCFSVSRRPSSSASTTLRCRPPVHPIPTVR